MRRPGGARRGLDMWLAQRASACYMALVLPVFLVWAAWAAPLDYPAWRTLFQPLGNKIAALLFIVALLLHAWIGLREIFIDYLHPLLARLGAYFLFATLYACCLAWAVDILWSVR